MPRGDLEDHRPLALRIINARLAAEVGVCHFRFLQTHEAESFAEPRVKRRVNDTRILQTSRRTSYARWSSIRVRPGGAGCCIRALGIRLGVC